MHDDKKKIIDSQPDNIADELIKIPLAYDHPNWGIW